MTFTCIILCFFISASILAKPVEMGIKKFTSEYLSKPVAIENIQPKLSLRWIVCGQNKPFPQLRRK